MGILKRLSIRSKFIILMLVVSIASIIAIGIIGNQSGKKILNDSISNQLTSLKNTKEVQIQDFFKTKENQLLMFSQNSMIVDSMRDFRVSYNLTKYDALTQEEAKKLDDYYKNDFLPKLEKSMASKPVFSNFRPKTVATSYLQYHYLANNSFQKKSDMTFAEDKSSYSKAHKKYHKSFKQIVSKLNFSDLFLINPETMEIVYSTYKRSDFATNLEIGAYKNSSLATLVKRIKNSSEKEKVYIEDFQKYEPSFNIPQAFMGVPIYDGDEKLGILAIKIDSNEIDAMMMNNYDFEKTGLKKTGEVYLVGADRYMRSQSRYLLENSIEYEKLLKKLKFPEEEIEDIIKFNTTVKIQKADTDAVSKALSGKSNTEKTINYLNQKMLSSYAPVNIEGLRWVIIAEMGLDEALKPISTFQKQLIIYTILLVFLVTLFAMFIARVFTTPLNKLMKGVHNIEAGKSTTIEVDTQDEFKELSGSFNKMGNKIKKQNETIEHILLEKEKLLLNILPAPIVERVENGEMGIGDSYDNVTVLFTSLTGFDSAFINESASKSIAWLNELIYAFDESAEKFGVEKIKTIGDDYMAACGLSVPRFDHVRRSVDFAIDMLKIIDRFNRDHNVNISLQVGIHSGTVIAGIIGRHKFVYDLWGEVVDISGYIRHEAILNTILITETSYQGLDQKEKFKKFGAVHVKGIGDIETWEYNLIVDHSEELTQQEVQKSV